MIVGQGSQDQDRKKNGATGSVAEVPDHLLSWYRRGAMNDSGAADVHDLPENNHTELFIVRRRKEITDPAMIRTAPVHTTIINGFVLISTVNSGAGVLAA